MAALSSRRSAGDVVALIEAEFAESPACGPCGSEAFSKWGVATGRKRDMCKARERTFNEKREKWLEYARAIVDGLSLSKTTKRLGVHLEASFRCRHRFLATSPQSAVRRLPIVPHEDQTEPP
jgi:transposase-like protein